MPTVSVVIPVYNIEEHLRQCLDSVAGQILQEIEIICVDDGSTDSSPVILNEYAKKDARFHIIHQENAGPGVARNRGMVEATGEYLIFLDSDDWFEADFLEKMVKRAEETSADITICRAVEFDTDTGRELPSEWMLKTEYLPGSTFSPKEISNYIFQFTYGWPWDKLYRTKSVQESVLQYPPLPNSEDLVFVFQSLTLAKRITVVLDTLIHHRMNRLSSVSNSRHRNPEVPYQAVQLLKVGLRKKEVYSYYERSFINWAMEFLMWNVANMGDPNAQREYFKKLKREWLPEMSFGMYGKNYYNNQLIYYKYILVKYTPWPVFSWILALYKKEKAIIEKAIIMYGKI